MADGKTIAIVILSVLLAIFVFAWLYELGTVAQCEEVVYDEIWVDHLQLEGEAYEIEGGMLLYIDNEREVYKAFPGYGDFFYVEDDVIYFTDVEELKELIKEL